MSGQPCDFFARYGTGRNWLTELVFGNGDPFWEMLSHDRVTVAVHAEAVVVSFLGELGLDVGLGLGNYRRFGPNRFKVDADRRGLCCLSGGNIGPVAGDSHPSKLLDLCLSRHGVPFDSKTRSSSDVQVNNGIQISSSCIFIGANSANSEPRTWINTI